MAKNRHREITDTCYANKALATTDCVVILTRDEAIEFQKLVEYLCRVGFEAGHNTVVNNIYNQLNEELEQQ